ncbi:MAG: RsmF rRNA methyltransferase first C-terminal domain-containing protein [Eubacteriales bacterium]|nr:RsmF rRNA methyltransferase first C-terminal domain-containing protein [Eubacteriales bacterium]
MGKKRTATNLEESRQQELPAAFVVRMKDMLGPEWDAFLASFSRERRTGLRINTLRRRSSDFAAAAPFVEDEIPWSGGAGYFCGRASRPGKMVLHEAGVYYLQEPSAMAVAALSGAKPGMRVLDLCAAPGGKSTQTASMLQGEGLLISNEIHPVRAAVLSQNMERMGVTNAVVTNEPPQRLAERFAMFFDLVIVDAPCSGEGMFRKEEAAIPNWSPENVEMCAARQREILGQAALMAAPGGRLVYSTCTFAPAEDEENAAWFLRTQPEFSMVDLPALIGGEKMDAWGLAAGVKPAGPTTDGTPQDAGAESDILGPLSGSDGQNALETAAARSIRLWPHKLEGEGHYMAVFERRGQALTRPSLCTDTVAEPDPVRAGRRQRGGSRSGRLPEAQAQKLWEQFSGETLCPDSETVRRISRGPFTLFGSEFYRLPCQLDLKGLRVLRPGLHLGTIKKDRFEPAHALALALSPEDVRCSAELAPPAADAGQDQNKDLSAPIPGESPAARAYLRGESAGEEDCAVTAEEMQKPYKGWCLVTAAGFPLGWGKAVGGRIKNHYPKGLRKFN